MEEARLKYEDLLLRKAELFKNVKNTRATVDRLKKDVHSLSQARNETTRVFNFYTRTNRSTRTMS